MNGHMLGKGGALGPLAGGCGSGIGPPFVGGIPGIPLNPGSMGKGCSLIPGLSPNIVPGPSSFIGDGLIRDLFTLQLFFHFCDQISTCCNQILAFEKA